MAQPPLSQQIRQLEEQLGTQLFERTTRKVELTAAGQLLLDRGRRILQDLEELESDVAEVGAGAAGVLRIGLSGSATYRLLPTLVQRARAELPGLKLSVHGEMLTPQMAADLEEGRLDVAVLRPPVVSPEIALAPLEHDLLVAALPAASPYAQRAQLDLADLAEEAFVGYPADSVVTRTFREACRAEGFTPRVVQEAAETSTLLSLVAAGMGIALVPMPSPTFAFQDIVFRPVRNAPAVDLAVAWRAGEQAPLVHRFLELFDTVPAPGRTQRSRRPLAVVRSPAPQEAAHED
jgi:DNA-binding transcriptional LysR family regulator